MGRGRSSGLQAFAAMAACAVGAALAQSPAEPPSPAPAPTASAAQAAGDANHGKAVAYTCLGCHGVEGYKNAYPMYSVPELRGQNPEYLLTALHGYRDGDRSHITMHSQSETLSDQDMADAAAFLAGKPLQGSGRPSGTVPQAAQLCVSCHGQDGVAVAPIYPSLAGQHEDYIVRALDEYKHGGRKNPVMKGFASNLTEADIHAVAAYFSRLTPSLATEPRPFSRLAQ